jgi:hypothetical protein
VSYSTVTKYVRRRRPEITAEQGRAEAAGVAGCVPQAKEPGAEAEVDFGDVFAAMSLREAEVDFGDVFAATSLRVALMTAGALEYLSKANSPEAGAGPWTASEPLPPGKPPRTPRAARRPRCSGRRVACCGTLRGT